MSRDSRKTHRRGRQTLRFLRAFVSSPRSVGAIAPSSSELARAMVAGLQFQPGDTVVELGPGTGALTAAIQALIPDSACYLGIEREDRFVHILRERFPDLCFVQGDAEDARELCRRHGLEAPRAILSGLPFTMQSPGQQDRILSNVAALLADGGTFRTFQYIHGYVLPTAVRFRRRTRQILGSRHHLSEPLLANLPPAYILTWQC